MGFRLSWGTSGRPAACAISNMARSPLTPYSAVTFSLSGPVTRTRTVSPCRPSVSAADVPSPPSATGAHHALDCAVCAAYALCHGLACLYGRQTAFKRIHRNHNAHSKRPLRISFHHNSTFVPCFQGKFLASINFVYIDFWNI